MTLSTRALSGLAGRFQAAEKRVQRAVRKVVKDTGEAAYSIAYADAPKKTHFMVNNLRLGFLQDGLVYELGFRERDFERASLPFYPIYVIFGTRFQAPNDFLFPANREAQREFRPALSRALSAAWGGR